MLSEAAFEDVSEEVDFKQNSAQARRFEMGIDES
jgi:hypothetical protein